MINVTKRPLLPVIIFAKIAIKRAFRDKTALFFIFLFPLIFLFVFGGIFARSNNVNFRVAIINQSSASFARQFIESSQKDKLFTIDPKATTLDQAKLKMSRGQLDAAILLPVDFGLSRAAPYPTGQAVIYYTQNNEQAARALTSVLEGIFQNINSQILKLEPPFTLRSELVNIKSLSPFDYTFAGLLGFSIIGLGIFGPINVFPELKKQGVLRRLHTTPLRAWQYFTANVLAAAVTGLLSIGVMFAVAITVFHLKVAGSVLLLIPFVVLSIGMIYGIGLAIGGWARNQQQAAPLGNIITFPMIFLSGTFFPRFLMPEWLQKASAFLPLTPVIDGIRLIATEGRGLAAVTPQIGLITGWMVIIYAIAFRVFRWE